MEQMTAVLKQFPNASCVTVLKTDTEYLVLTTEMTNADALWLLTKGTKLVTGDK